MIIVRAPRRPQFEILPRTLLMDSRLSFRARGVAVRLLANMDGYKMSSADLARESPNEGRYAVLSALRELRDQGYISWERRQVDRGRWVTIVTISDTPAPIGSESQPLHSGGVCEVQPPDSGRPAPGRSHSKNTSTTISTNTTTAGDGELNWDSLPQLSDKERTAVVGVLEGIQTSLRQDLLDELAGRWASTNPQPLKRPMAWLAEVAAKARRGEYVPDLALGVRAARQQRESKAEAELRRRQDLAETKARRSDPKNRARFLENLRRANEELGAPRTDRRLGT